MGRGGKNLILGIAIGAIGMLLAVRLKQLREQDDPDALMEQLTEQLDALERTFQKV
jgi:hypothetical protein